MITIEQAHQQDHTVFAIFDKENSLNDWIKRNTYLRNTRVAEHVADVIKDSKVNPADISATVYSCYRAEGENGTAGMFLIELKWAYLGNPKSEPIAHVAIRTLIVNGVEQIVFGSDVDIKKIDLSDFKREEMATIDDLRMWMTIYRGDGRQGQVLFKQLRDFLEQNNLTQQQVAFKHGNALRHPREGRGGLIKLDMCAKGVRDLKLATLRFETTWLSFDNREILAAEGLKIKAEPILAEMNVQANLSAGVEQSNAVDAAQPDQAASTQPAQEADVAIESNDTNQAANEAAGETKAAEAAAPQTETPKQGADKAQQQAPRMGGFMGEAMRAVGAMGGAFAGQNSDSDEVEYSKIEASGRQPVWAGIEWLKNNTGNEELARTDYFDKLIANLLKLHDVEADLVELAFAPSKHASLLGTKSKHTDDISSELGIVDMAMLVPVAGQPIHVRRVGTLLSFTTTAQWEHHVRIGARERQQEGILYLTNPDMRQTHCLAVNKPDASPFGMTALEVLMQTRQDRELMTIEKLWHEIKRRAERALEQNRRLASQVVIKLERIASPILRSNHMLELGLIKGKVYSPGADSKLLFGFEVRTELESIDQGVLMEVVSDYEVDQPKIIPAPIFQPLSKRGKMLGGKTVDVGSAANPIPDSDAPKTDPSTLFQDTEQPAARPEVIRQDWNKGPRIKDMYSTAGTQADGSAAVNMMQAGQQLRYVDALEGTVGFTEFTVWLHKNLADDAQINVADALAALKITESHFFEIWDVTHAKAWLHDWLTTTPGHMTVRAFDPDIAGSEVLLVLKLAVHPTPDPKQDLERITELATVGKKIAAGQEDRCVSSHSLPPEAERITEFKTNAWIFFNHAVGGIIGMLDNENSHQRVRDAVSYIDRLYPNKGVNNERYHVRYDGTGVGSLKLSVVDERTETLVVAIELQML